MKKPDIKETIEKLNTMLHKERNAELKRRIHVLILLKNGECRKRKEIANRLAEEIQSQTGYPFICQMD